MFYWLDSATQDWISSGWFDVPCTGTRATLLNIVQEPYLGQFNLNYTNTEGLPALYISSMFRVEPPEDTAPKTFPASAAPTSAAPSTSSASAPASASSPAPSHIASDATNSAKPGIIAGSVVGAVVLLLAIAGVVFFCLRKRRRSARYIAPLWPSGKMDQMDPIVGTHDKGLNYDHWRKDPSIDPTYMYQSELDARRGLVAPTEMEVTKKGRMLVQPVEIEGTKRGGMRVEPVEVEGTRRSEMPVEPVEVEAFRRGEMPG